MKLGFVSAILPDLSFQEVLQTASEIGYDCVEIMCWPNGSDARRYAGVTHLDVMGFDEPQAAEVQQLCRDYNIEISGLGYYPNPLSPDDAESHIATEHIKHVIRACQLLNLPVMNTFIGRDWSRSVDDNFLLFQKTWRPLISFAADCGVRVAIENCPMLFSADEWPGGKNLATTPAIWRRMFADISSDYFGLNYDPSHFIWMMMDVIKPLQEFSGKLFHIHAKDVRVDRQALDDVGILSHPLDFHTPKLPGLGDVDWGKFIGMLREVGYDGPVCVEVEDRTYENSLSSRRQALEQSYTYLRNFIPKQ